MTSPDASKRELLRRIPQVNEILEHISKSGDAAAPPRNLLLSSARRVLDDIRRAIMSEARPTPSDDDLELEPIAARVRKDAESSVEHGFRKVINATGVILHTNLGRAPLPKSALEALHRTSSGYCNLEFRLEDGTRGSRQNHLESLLCRLTGASGALVVNNNAAAALLTVSALAHGREVLVSRGELVEIGDSFRLPDILRQGGATLVEVGTTNRTRLDDYRNAIGPDTALIMKIHQSNFRIVGYGQQVGLPELVELGRQHSLPVVEDLGSGTMVDLARIGLTGEHTPMESLGQGADLVMFSGDKLLGGPQAGIIVGGAEYVEALREHPLARALRIDKMTVAALEATLIEYLDTDGAWVRIPTLRMLREPEDSVRKRAARLKRSIDRAAGGGLTCRLVGDISRAGGGSLPTADVPTFCVSVQHSRIPAESLERLLRKAEPPVVCRVREDSVLLDARTVSDDEVPLLAAIVAAIE